MGLKKLLQKNPGTTAAGNIVPTKTGKIGAALVQRGAGSCQGCGKTLPTSARKSNTCRTCTIQLAKQW